MGFRSGQQFRGRPSLDRGVCCERHWRLARSSWLPPWLRRSCFQSQLAESCTGRARRNRSAFWLVSPNRHQRLQQAKMLRHQLLLQVCCHKPQMRRWRWRTNQQRTARLFRIPLKLQRRISSSPKLRTHNHRSPQCQTLPRPLPRALFPKPQLRARLLRHRRKAPRLHSRLLRISRARGAKRNALLLHRRLARVRCASECLESRPMDG